MTPQQLLDLISQGESASVEFKSSFQNEAIETLSAFANTRGGRVSDGGHITGLTVEKIKSSQCKSHLRNKQIATIFRELNLIEKYGSGVRRVIDSFVAYGLPEPTFEATQGGLAVTVYKTSNPQSGGVDGGVSGGVNSAVANLEAQLLVLVQNTPGLNAVGLSHQTNTPLRTVQRQLKQLKAKGQLVFRGSTKTGGYWPTSQANTRKDTE